MTGRIVAVAPPTGVGQSATAEVELEGVSGRIGVTYWPELLEQWGAEALRVWIINEAATYAAAQAATHVDHARLLGSATAAPVCREGEIGCEKLHEPAPPEQVPADGATVAPK